MAATAAKKAAGKATATKSSVKKPAKTVPKKKLAPRKIASKKTPARKTAAGSADAAAAAASERIDRKIASLEDWRGARMAELRKLIHDVDPQVVEHWKWMGTPVWSHDGMYVLANAHKEKVKLMFFHGAKLADPKKLFNASLDGGKWRAIDIREGDTVDKPALKALLREAIAYNVTHPVPKSNGSRG